MKIEENIMKSRFAVRGTVFATALSLVALCVAPASAFRLIQNNAVGRVTAGLEVECNDPGGFAHWRTLTMPWRLNTGNQGAGKSAAMQSALDSWTQVTPAPYVLAYLGTTNDGWATDGKNTVLWANGNGCTGNCLALTALVLQTGQRIVESDITFNNNVAWNTNGSATDVEAVMAHELGHTLGIHHTEVGIAPLPTMFEEYFGTGGRSLEQDDRDALNCINTHYPPDGPALSPWGTAAVAMLMMGAGAKFAVRRRERLARSG